MPFVTLVEASTRRLPIATVLRLFPLLGAVTLWRVESTSLVEPNLWAFSGAPAHVCLVWYGLTLAVLAVCPYRLGFMHPASAALAVLVIGGRTAAFAQIMLDGRPDLEGAVWERVWLLLAVLIWHWTAAAISARNVVSGGVG